MAKQRKTKKVRPTATPDSRRKPTTKTATKSPKAKFGAKAAFVRAHANLAAKDVVDLAAKAGLAMSVNHVYNVRSTSGISRRVGTARKAKPRAANTHTAAPSRGLKGHSSAAESQFRHLVLQIGVGRARTLLRDVEAKLAALIEGR